jgi:hypothetical protein
MRPAGFIRCFRPTFCGVSFHSPSDQSSCVYRRFVLGDDQTSATLLLDQKVIEQRQRDFMERRSQIISSIPGYVSDSTVACPRYGSGCATRRHQVADGERLDECIRKLIADDMRSEGADHVTVYLATTSSDPLPGIDSGFIYVASDLYHHTMEVLASAQSRKVLPRAIHNAPNSGWQAACDAEDQVTSAMVTRGELPDNRGAGRTAKDIHMSIRRWVGAHTYIGEAVRALEHGELDNSTALKLNDLLADYRDAAFKDLTIIDSVVPRTALGRGQKLDLAKEAMKLTVVGGITLAGPMAWSQLPRLATPLFSVAKKLMSASTFSNLMKNSAKEPITCLLESLLERLPDNPTDVDIAALKADPYRGPGRTR